LASFLLFLEPPTVKLKTSLKKDFTEKAVEKGPTEVNKSEGGMLFDKVELEEDEDKVVDDMKVEEYEEEELNPRYGQY
jgi:ribulose 1,5-bisphosphate synthetase/thiazole synthase